MSTDLYRVRVLALDPSQRKVTFRVFLVYYDWSGVPTDPSFFFRILWDEADTRYGRGGPLGEEVDVRQYLDEAWVNANTQRFVEHVTRLTLRNDPLPPGKTPPTFVYDGYTDEDGLTQGDFEVLVTDPRWLAHLKVGQTWQTTSYETRADMPRGRETLFADQDEVREVIKVGRKKAGAKKVSAVGEKAAKKVSAAGKRTAKKAGASAGGKKTAKKATSKPAKKGVKKAAKKVVKKAAKKGVKKAAKKVVKKAAEKVVKKAGKKGVKKAVEKAGKKGVKKAARSAVGTRAGRAT